MEKRTALVVSRDAHFPTGNRETGNQGPGNFPREMEDREKSGNREKMLIFEPKIRPVNPKVASKFAYFGIKNIVMNIFS